MYGSALTYNRPRGAPIALGRLIRSVGDRSASSTARVGIIRRAFGHAGVNPGHNLIDLRTGQERSLQRHLAKATDTTHQRPHQMRFAARHAGLDGAVS